MPLKREINKILYQHLTLLGEDGFGMELHAVDGMDFVFHGHDFAIIGLRCGDER